MATETTEPRPLSIDVPALTELLDGRYAAVRARVRQALVDDSRLLEDAERMGLEEFRDEVLTSVRAMTERGLTGFGFPEEYGGGADVGAAIAAFETSAFGDLSTLVKTGVQFGLFGGAILQLGTERHHAAYLPDVVAGRLLGCFAMTETGHGSDVQGLRTTARYDAGTDEFVISTPDRAAYKDYIGGAARHAELAVVFAQLEVGGERHGVHAFLVPIRRDGEPCTGVHIEDDGLKMGLNGVDNGRLAFADVRVPRGALLNRFAEVSDTGEYRSSIESPGRRFFTMLGTLVQGRVSVGGAAINAAKVALTVAIRYGDRRRQFEGADGTERVLLDYGLHQRRLLPLVARTYALHFAQEVLAAQLHDASGSGSDQAEEADEVAARELESRAAGTKALGSWHATATIQECREACGGAGYLAVNRFAALKADTDVFATFEGDNHVLLQLVGKGLLTHHRTAFEDLDQLGTARYVANLAVQTVVERTSALTLVERLRDRWPGDDKGDLDAGLLDPAYHRAMLEFREEHLVGSAARRLRAGSQAGEDLDSLLSRVQSHIIAAARAHVERLVLTAFLDRIDGLADGALKDVLNRVCDLHALSVIEADRAWFMEHSRLSTQRSKAISREIDRLCAELRPVARELVDGFGVPEELLRSGDLIG